MKFYVEIKQSEKTKNTYAVLIADLDYKQKPITYDKNVIAEICDITLRKLETMPLGEKIEL